jgi:murein DD-endopeptidase MepM/ murein hydrolase activator NlpD
MIFFQNKKVLILLIFVACGVQTWAQFNTVLPKERLKSPEADVVMAENLSNQTPDGIKTVQPSGTPDTIDKPGRIVLDGMRKRQYLSLPVDELTVTSPYGYRNDPITGRRKFHRGIDLNADFNYVYSVMPGKVVKSGKNRDLGEFVQVQHGEFVTTYGHLFQRLVSAKDVVEAGQPVGISGSTGRSTGEHLHFGITFNGKYINPQPILNYISSIMQEAKGELERIITNELTPIY